MKDVGQLTVLVWDKGQFPFVAERLARDCKRVIYHNSHEDAFQTIKKGCIGGGFEDIELLIDKDPWEVKRDVDLFVFPDIGFSGEQAELRSQGYPVWGCGGSDQLESNRGLFMETLKSIGMSVPKYVVIQGMDALKKHLHHEHDKMVKIDRWRADWETLKWRDWDRDEMELVYREVKLGRMKDEVTFYVIDQVECAFEDGFDTWFVKGWPETMIHGLEAKDQFFAGHFDQRDDLPEGLAQVCDEFGPVLEKRGLRGPFSCEVIVTPKRENYFIDPTPRVASPPGQMMTEMIGNYTEVAWEGANGECVEPEPTDQWGLQGVVEIEADASEWGSIEIPSGLKRWIKPSFCCQMDKSVAFPPAGEIIRAWLVGTGETFEDALEAFTTHRKALPDGAKVQMEPLRHLIEEMEKADEMGMPITDEVLPDAKEVFENA